MSESDGDKPMKGKFWVDVMSSVEINVADDEAITRCDTKEWANNNVFRPLDRDGILQYWAYNCLVMGVEDASELDGWADLAVGTVTMRVDQCVEFERIVEPKPAMENE